MRDGFAPKIQPKEAKAMSKNGGQTNRTPNDDRSDSMNPNNDAYWDSLDNRSRQLDPEHSEYWNSRTN